MKERLEGSDYRFIAICLVLLAATTWYAAGNFFRAFPEASIDFRVNRAEGERLAAQFLAEQRYNPSGYRRASRFSYDDETKTFLEREFGLVGGDILHGQMTLDQIFSLRPLIGHARYRGPIEGLYHCGAGAHPGGGVSGAPGHNAAREIIRDLR